MLLLRSLFAVLLTALPLCAEGLKYGEIPNQPPPSHQYGPAPQQVVQSPNYGRVSFEGTSGSRALQAVLAELMASRPAAPLSGAGGLLQRQGEAPARQAAERQPEPHIAAIGSHPPQSAENSPRLDKEIARWENKVKETDKRLAEIERIIVDRTGEQRREGNFERVVTGNSRRNNVEKNHANSIDSLERTARTLGWSKTGPEFTKGMQQLEQTRAASLAAIDRDVVKANKMLDVLRTERAELTAKQDKRKQKIEARRTEVRKAEAKKNSPRGR